VNGTFYLDNMTFYSGRYCFWLRENSSGSIINSNFTSCGKGIEIYNNAIVTMSSILIDHDFFDSCTQGISFDAVYGYANARITNNRVQNFGGGKGIYIAGFANNVYGENNSITSDGSGGGAGLQIFYASKNNTFVNTYVYNVGHCIMVDSGSSNNTILNSTLVDCTDVGITVGEHTTSALGSSLNNYFIGGSISGAATDHGISTDNNAINTVRDFTIAPTITNDIWLDDMADTYDGTQYPTLYLLNVTYDTAFVEDGIIYRSWYLNVYVNGTEKSAPVEDANVADSAKNGTVFQWSARTKVNGWITTQNATVHTQTKDTNVSFNNHSITATAVGYNSALDYPKITGNTNVFLQMTGGGVVPEFSSVLMVIVAMGIVITGIAAIRKRNL
jgi:hypothetical protein